MLKIILLLRHLQISRANNLRSSRIKNAKLQDYCFYMNTNQLGDMNGARLGKSYLKKVSNNKQRNYCFSSTKEKKKLLRQSK